MNRDPLNREAQKDPIYLLQRRDYNLTCRPLWLGYDGDGYWIEFQYIPDHVDVAEWQFYTKGEIDEQLLFEYLCSYCKDDAIAAVENWVTRYVFLTRDEAEHYGKMYEHNCPFGWRVYCISACGELAKILNELPDKV
jgi:hypothetical protein